MRKGLVGVDIGNNDISFAVMHAGAFRLTSERLPDRLIHNNVITSPELLVQEVRRIRKNHRITGRACSVVLPESATFFRRMTMPAVSAEELALNLPYEFRDYTSNDSARYFYDYAVERTLLDEEGKPSSIEILAAAAQKEVVQEYAELMGKMGMRLAVALPREMAVINLIKYSKSVNAIPQEYYCIVDIGYEHTLMYIFSGTTLRAYKAIEIGCNRIDDAISEAENIDRYLAATYRETNHESVLDGDACRRVYERLVLEVRKVINFYIYDEGEKDLKDIYYAGVGSGISTLVDMITQELEYHPHSILDTFPKYVSDSNASQVAGCMAAIGATM